jgi:hypothetical protein
MKKFFALVLAVLMGGTAMRAGAQTMPALGDIKSQEELTKVVEPWIRSCLMLTTAAISTSWARW